MATVSNGGSTVFDLASGETWRVTGGGEVYVDYLLGTPDAGFASLRLAGVGATAAVGPFDSAARVRVRATDGDATFAVEAAEETGSSGLLQSATVTVTAADLIASATTPIELVAAPGAGKALVVEHITFVTDDGDPFPDPGEGNSYTMTISIGEVEFLYSEAGFNIFGAQNRLVIARQATTEFMLTQENAALLINGEYWDDADGTPTITAQVTVHYVVVDV